MSNNNLSVGNNVSAGNDVSAGNNVNVGSTLVLRVGAESTGILSAPTLTTGYTIELPPAKAATEDQVVSVSGVAGTVVSTDFINHAPSSITQDTGFAAWVTPAEAVDYWSYAKPAAVPTFTLLRGGYGYIKGKRVTWAANQTIPIVYNANNYLVIDDEGKLERTDSGQPPTYTDKIPLFELFDDGVMALPFVKKENHPISFPINIATFLHHNLGNIIRGAGAVMNIRTPGLGAATANRQWYITGDDVVEDHGLSTTIPATVALGVETARYFYKTLAGRWMMDSFGDTVPIKYTLNGAPQAISNNQRGIIRMYVTEDDLNDSTPQYFGVLHDAQFSSLSAANAAISGGLLTVPTDELYVMEPTQLGYLIVRNVVAGGYIEEIVIQKNTFNSRYIGGASSGSHLALSDISAGQYLDGGHTNLVTKVEAASVPTADSDTDNYKTGSLWLNTTNADNRDLYVCYNNADATAVWRGMGWWAPAVTPIVADTKNGTISMGSGALNNTFTGNFNVAIGVSALSALTSGLKNVCIGYESGKQLTTGSENVVVGGGSLLANSVGTGNVVVGANSAELLTANNNVVVGPNLFGAATSAHSCIVIGRDGVAAITTGNNIIGIGNATSALPVGAENAICIGQLARTINNGSIAIGSSSTALKSASALEVGAVAIGSGYDATYIGAIASHIASIAIGGAKSNASGAAATNTNAIAVGVKSAASAVDSFAIGGSSISSATRSIAIGTFAEAASADCVAIGSGNLATGGAYVFASADSCICIGTGPNTGTFNGPQASGGNGNISIGCGYDANGPQTFGSHAIAIGTFTSATGTSSTAPSVAIGYGAVSAANQFTLGPSLTDCRYYDASGWTNLSDARSKNNITAVTDAALPFIEKLSVKEFQMVAEPGMYHYGFIAQEVLEHLTEREINEHRIVPIDPETGYHRLAIQPIFVKNIKATQELALMVKTQANQIQQLQADLTALTATVQSQSL